MKKTRNNKNKLKGKSSSLRELPLLKAESLKLSLRIERGLTKNDNKKLFKKKPRQLQPQSQKSALKENSLEDFKQPKKEVKILKRSNSVTDIDQSGSLQLDKRQRFEIFKRRLTSKPSVKNTQEAIEMINKTLTEVEDKYAPKKDSKYAFNSKKYGRMFPIPKDRIKLNLDTGITELLAVGITIYVFGNGSFEIWTVPRGNFQAEKIYFKPGINE